MNNRIDISQLTFERLNNMATGFNDTPEAVIIRLLDMAEEKEEANSTQIVNLGQVSRPKLIFCPEDENLFKQKLIETQEAEVVIHKSGGTREATRWNARNFSEASNLRGNIWAGFLRDWRSRGIIAAEFTILPRDANLSDDAPIENGGGEDVTITDRAYINFVNDTTLTGTAGNRYLQAIRTLEEHIGERIFGAYALNQLRVLKNRLLQNGDLYGFNQGIDNCAPSAAIGKLMDFYRR